ncbi:unnamed protein product [Penicillium salamii]|nr:unnamed protein product [Penicillium salamii]
MISCYLSPVDIACHALGNHHLRCCFVVDAFEVFSKGRSPTPAPTDHARTELLSRLSRDIPQYYLCFICLRLHLWKNVGPPNSDTPIHDAHLSDLLAFANLRLTFEIQLFSYPSLSCYIFQFVHLQLAMRRFYHGPEFGIPVESLLYAEVGAAQIGPKDSVLPQSPASKAPNKDSRKDTMMTMFSAEARICSTPPGLCMRMQDIGVVTRQNASWMWSDRALMNICKHISTFDTSLCEILSSQIKRYCSTTSISVPVEQGRCDKCNTSWQLEIRDLDESRASIALTRWMDLGPGLSIEDVDWKYCHLCSLSSPPERTLVDSRLRFERDSIQAGLPGALSEEGMYRRNVAFLRDKAYRKMMTYVGDGIFTLHGEPKAKTGSSQCIIL